MKFSKTVKRALALAMIAGTASAAHALHLNPLVGDNMVLQQQTNARLWGKADPGSTVTVTTGWDGRAYTTVTDRIGSWSLAVATPAASFTAHDITFSDGTEKLTVHNVLIGEVWLASGQSNMQMPLKGFGGCCVQNGLDEAINARRVDGVRMFNVPLRKEYEPQEECDGHWMTTDNFRDVMEFSATAWYFAKSLSAALNVPVGIVNCAYGGSRVESWLPREILETYPDVSLKKEDIEAMTEYHRPLLMYNGMFSAVENYTYKGIIWYQGCSNVGKHEQYAQRLADMVEHWRERIGLGEIPFYYVEIAPYDYGSESSAENAAPGAADAGALLREAQFKAQKLIPNSGMVSINDLAEPFERFNIHPRRKEPVGQRLSWMALHRTYGHDNVTDSGPVYKSWTPKGREAWVAFENLPMGICRNYMIEGFELAGPDRVFHKADAWLHWQTNELVLTSPEVEQPVAVRYCFRDFQPGTLCGGNEQPAVPFRTDNW